MFIGILQNYTYFIFPLFCHCHLATIPQILVKIIVDNHILGKVMNDSVASYPTTGDVHVGLAYWVMTGDLSDPVVTTK